MTTSYSDPNSNINTAWDTNSYTYIDDAVRQPTAPSSGAGEECNDQDKSGDLRQEWGHADISAIPGETVDSWRLWYYLVNKGTNDLKSPDLRVNGTWKGAPTSTSGFSAGWQYADFSGGESLDSGITGLGSALSSPTMSNGDVSDAVAAIYIECKSSPSGGGGGGSPVVKEIQSHWSESQSGGML